MFSRIKDILNQEIFHKVYLFSWSEFPKNDNVRFKDFLTQKFLVNRVKIERIEHINDMTIRVTTAKNFLSLRLNDERTKVSIEIDGAKIDDEFIAKSENGKLNIYRIIRFSKIKDLLDQEIFPNVFLTERILKESIEKIEKIEFNIELSKYKEVYELKKEEDELIKELKEYHQKEIDRKKVIEEKAKASLFVITLSITLLLGSLNLFNDGKNEVIVKFPILFILFILGLIYLIFSGFASVHALNIGKIYDISVDDRIKKIEGKHIIKNFNKRDWINQLYKNIVLNQKRTNIRSNYVYAAFIGIRNGIILISIFFIIVYIGPYLWQHTQIPITENQSAQIINTTLNKTVNVIVGQQSVNDQIINTTLNKT